MSETPVKDVVRALLTLPPERVAEVYDFILFLQSRYGQVVEVNDAWSDEDLSDLSEASLKYAREAMWPEEEPDDSSG